MWKGVCDSSGECQALIDYYRSVKNVAAARSIERSRCDRGNRDYCMSLGRDLADGAPAEALTLFLPACRDGDEMACRWVGKVSQGDFDSVATLKRRCSEGQSASCWALTQVAERSKSVADEKFGWKHACDRKDSSACFNLAIVHRELGERVEARRALRLSCDLDNPDGCYSLALADGSASTMARARRLHQKACNEGSNHSCEKLKTMTKHGF